MAITVHAFHGTTASFDEFEIGDVGGVWFTSDREHAEYFGDVGEYELRFSHPVYIDGAARKFAMGGYEADGRLSAMLRVMRAKGHDGAVLANWEGAGTCYIAMYTTDITRVAA